MSLSPRPLALLLAFISLPFLTYCGSADGSPTNEAADLAAIERESAELATERRALQPLVAQLETARAARRDAVELERQVESRRDALRELAGRLDQRLVDFLNAYRPVPGEPLSAEQRRVLDVKITEDLAAAAEFIGEGGDYTHAIQIYRELLTLDPDNAQVQAALAKAEAEREMTSERFATLRKGMTRAQVRAALGMPNLKNIQTFEEQGVVAWFYPTDAAGTAGVYFQAEGNGEPRVYRWDFAVQAPQ